MQGARVKRGVLSLLDKLRVHVVRVRRTMHTIVSRRIAERSDELDRSVQWTPENERHLDIEMQVDFDGQASVGVWQCSRFGKGNDLATRAR